MEQNKENLEMLDLILRPGFCVKDNRITKCNRAARALLLKEGDELLPLLLTGSEAYCTFSSGCLYLTLQIQGQSFGASVSRLEDGDIFILDQVADLGELQAMALAAQELRGPLASIMICTEKLLSSSSDPDAARLNQGFHQMLRLIGNMSDAVKYTTLSRQETHNISKLMDSIFEKAAHLIAQSGIRLEYQGCQEPVYCLADEEQLERAVLNILSNAIKHLPQDGVIRAEFSRCGRNLRLSIQDNGSGIAQDILPNIFRQYLRQPGLEDSRTGIGLGMVLIRSAAANHGGAVLIDQPEEAGTRITLTLAIRQSANTSLRSPMLRVDYAGEKDHALVEFSDSLPSECYK